MTSEVAPPVPVTVWYDYHCPYSRRVVEWLDGLGADRTRPAYRSFALEQVNHDPGAATWRIWEQPLDYEHYRGRRDRRGLAAFLATELLAATEDEGVVARFRRTVYAARFDEGADISNVAVLAGLASAAGARSGGLDDALGDATLTTAARARMAADWAEARAKWAIFGVPTLQVADTTPFYVRLGASLAPGDRGPAWERLLDLRRTVPLLIELKEPELLEGP